MRIWIIGTDAVAKALGRSWAQAGHQVLFSFGDRVDWDALAAETGGRVGTPAEGAAAEVVLLAAPWAGVGKLLRAAGSLAGKVVLDATNPHQPMVGASGAEEVALRAPEARVVKAFNTLDLGEPLCRSGCLVALDVAGHPDPDHLGYRPHTASHLPLGQVNRAAKRARDACRPGRQSSEQLSGRSPGG